MTLRNARISASMTQRELACRLGVSDVAVGNWERGSQEIPGNRLAQVYQILKPHFANTDDAAVSMERHAA
jgi:transcriptional regulator with XRE-family HTH domain